jgi:hypothetical protein
MMAAAAGTARPLPSPKWQKAFAIGRQSRFYFQLPPTILTSSAGDPERPRNAIALGSARNLRNAGHEQ